MKTKEFDSGDCSKQQREWQVLVEKFREKLEAKIDQSHNLSCGECYDLARALRDTIALEASARTFDDLVDKSKRTWETN